MNDYILSAPITQEKIFQKVKKNVKDNRILEIGKDKKGQTYITTDWFTYSICVKHTQVKLPVMWSPTKRPYLIAGILLVLVSMFSFGQGITDVMMIVVFLGIGGVNAFKRREIVDIRKAILKALSIQM